MRKCNAALLVLSTFVFAGCGGKKPPATVAQPESAPSLPSTAGQSNADDAGDERAAEEARARAEMVRLRDILQQMVFFDYDRADLRGDAMETLDAKVRVLHDHPQVSIRIEGHADERGSVEYNLALSLRRAERVQEYFTGFGIARSRLQVTGYGEERPLEAGTGEMTYARNRRAEFTIVSGLTSGAR